MKQRDWELLGMKPPSANHDAFHDYVTVDGRLTDKGYALQNFASEMRKVVSDRAPKSGEPMIGGRMNIGNQINQALNDIRGTLVLLVDFGKTLNAGGSVFVAAKARHQFDLTLQMIQDYREKRIDIPWVDRRPQVDEEFS